MAYREEQIASMDWHQQRHLFRKINHERVVRAEGLRADKHTGDIKRPPLLSAMKEWGEGEFEVIRGIGLDQELRDLARDAERYDVASTVRHEIPDEPMNRIFTLQVNGNMEIMSDDEIDSILQEVIARTS